ncbi:MAG: DUF1499 domain-containing protein [bacterium]|nr:DUF1499 domain-containing protein [Gammaproteobacteria bacterium]HIL97797.1 DUF1499 domain-containing protein [Pseudomonadales bacterium]
MNETKWWSKLFIFSAGICLFLLVAGPLGYKFGISDLLPSLVTLLVALVGAVIVVAGSLIMLVVANKNGLVKDRNLLVAAVVISIIPVVIMAPQIGTARSVPLIHDVSTDTNEPPEFVMIAALRENAPNSLVYEFEGSASKLAEMQSAAYPDVKTLMSKLPVEEAVERAVSLLVEQGLELISVDKDRGIVEATATTFWFGFKDDVVVRVRPDSTGSRIDVRSISRVGQSDVGVNAARILKFTNAF